MKLSHFWIYLQQFKVLLITTVNTSATQVINPYSAVEFALINQPVNGNC